MIKKNKIITLLTGASMAINSIFGAVAGEESLNKAGDTFLSIASVGADWLLIFAGVALFFALIFIGVQFLWARKSEDGDKIKAVNNWFKSWVMGFIIILVAWGAKAFFFSFGK